MSNDPIHLEAAKPGRRRRYTAEQKRALLDEATKPGGSISETARRYGVAPSLLFQWKRVMDDASKKGLKANQRVVPEERSSRRLKARIRELERMLGKKTMEAEILQGGGGDCPGKKVDLGRQLARRKRWPVTRVAAALGISQAAPFDDACNAVPKPREPLPTTPTDEELLARIRAHRRRPAVVRVPACHRAPQSRSQDAARVNHKRIYRVMREADLLLAQVHRAAKLETAARPAEIITMASDMRWCSDMFEIRCWNGEKRPRRLQPRLLRPGSHRLGRGQPPPRRRRRPRPDRAQRRGPLRLNHNLATGKSSGFQRQWAALHSPRNPRFRERTPASRRATPRRTRPNPTAWPRAS